MAAQQQDIWSKILLWNCRDECRYHCMWRTVQGFLERGYTIPKFHGKWPFKRILGVQEPASTLASLLNLAAHVYMFTEMKRQLPAASRMYARVDLVRNIPHQRQCLHRVHGLRVRSLHGYEPVSGSNTEIWFHRKHLAKKTATDSRTLASATGGGAWMAAPLTH
ncbi:unnamed protein product [Leptidea sinapis]|uniref:Post-GPI attachment to proteins factor 3 n=1 Tax=Leptidea sinapis TaxID=189913 RepID=A0A5E4QLX9_9NEOP|nr:unnamed protein product [Leptidea sinapis]